MIKAKLNYAVSDTKPRKVTLKITSHTLQVHHKYPHGKVLGSELQIS